MDFDSIMKTASATLTVFGMKILGAVIAWVIGRYLIRLAVRMLSHALFRQHIDATLQRYLGTILSVSLTILLIVAVLAQLRKEHYGYTLRKDLAALGIEIDEGTLYPLLRRLETQGLLASEWREENNRRKRFYKLSRDGRAILKQLLAELEKINASLTRII